MEVFSMLHRVRAGLVAAVIMSTAHRQVPVWRINPVAVVTVGTSQSGTNFSRIAGAMRLQDGFLAVADAGTLTIAVFDSSGRRIAVRGGKGRGPGEFEDLSLVGRRGDSLVVFDVSQMRLTTMEPRGGGYRVEAAPPAPDGTHGYPFAVTADGSLLVLPIRPTSMRRPDGVFRDSITVRIVRAGRAEVSEVGPLPWLTHLAVNPSNSERAMAVGRYPFGPSLFVGATNVHFIVADSDEPKISFYTPDGKNAGAVSLGLSRKRFNETAVAHARAHALEDITNPRTRLTVEARYASRYRPEFEPFFSDLIASRDGSVWVERFRTDPGDPRNFVVISSQAILANVQVWAGARVVEVGRDYLVIVESDADGAEHVSVHRYTR